jgi:hypothetical protein
MSIVGPRVAVGVSEGVAGFSALLAAFTTFIPLPHSCG